MAAKFKTLQVKDRLTVRNIAILQRDEETSTKIPEIQEPAPQNLPPQDLPPLGLFWMGGFKSSMDGSKATALDALGAATGREVTRFDYSGHGQSSGKFEDGTISDWLDDGLAVFEQMTHGNQIVVGSSMGGWLALLLNKHLRAREINRVKALILIAPAVDMTADLMRASFSADELVEYESTNQVARPSAYSDEPYVLTRALLEDGDKHLLFGHTLQTHCPVHIIQGVKDEDVPVEHALKLVSHLLQDEVTVTLVPDGDHSLSRPQDLELLGKIIAQIGRG